MTMWGDFQGLIEVTRGGRGVNKLENWGDVIYGWSLSCIANFLFSLTSLHLSILDVIVQVLLEPFDWLLSDALLD